MAEFNLEGLLGNVFSGGGNYLDEYLTPEQRAAMQRNAMLAASAALLKAGGESTRRIGIGEALGGAFEAGQAGYEKAQTGALTQMALKQKMDEAKRAAELRKRIAGVFTPQTAMPGAAPAAMQPAAPMTLPKVGDPYLRRSIIDNPERREDQVPMDQMQQMYTTQADLDALKNYKGSTVQLPTAGAAMPPTAQGMARPMNPNAAMANQYRQVAKMLAENGQIEQAMKSVDMALKLDPPANLSDKAKLLSELGLAPTIANLRLLEKPEGPSEKTKLLAELGLAPTIANLRLLEKPEGLSEKTKLLAELGLQPTIANLRLLEKPQNVDKAPRTQQVQLEDGTIGLINMDTGAVTRSTVGGVEVKGKSEAPVAFSEASRKLNNLKGNISAYKTEINADKTVFPSEVPLPFGARIPLPTGADTARLRGKYQSLLMGVKDLYELGALTGPDMGIISEQLTNPASFSGMFTSRAAMREQIKVLEDMAGRAEENLSVTYKRKIPAASTSGIPAAPGARPADIQSIIDQYRRTR